MAKKPDRGWLGKPITKKQISAIYLRDFKKSLGLLAEPTPDPVTELHLKKMLGLLLYYDIDRKSPDCWFQLSYALALKHELGFKVAKKTGPKNRYGEGFVRAVAEIRQRKGLKSDKAAILALQAEGRCAGHLPTLLARLREARAPLKARPNLEKVTRASREAFIREAMQALESPPPKGPTAEKSDEVSVLKLRR